MKKLYPLKLEAVCKNIIWGGELLSAKYNKPGGKIAEAWELAVHPEGICNIQNGEYAGIPLSEYLGSKSGFPLMIKLIDARESLSIQVHPVKTEMWYIVEADEDAKLVYGLKEPFDETVFKKSVSSGTVEELLNYKEVHRGDVFFIPKGLVHAIGSGILIAEIQENSNVTYRIYDYGRLQNGKPRELHTEQALKTIRDFSEDEINILRFSREKKNDTTLAACGSFKVNKYTVDGSLTLEAKNSFVSIICLDGEGDIDGERFVKGDSYYIPAGYGDFCINSDQAEIIVSEI